MNQKLISWYRMIVDYTYDLEFFRDRDGTVVYTNLTFGRLTGYDTTMLMAKKMKFEDIIHPKDRHTYDLCLKMMSLGKSYNDIEYRIIDINGQVFNVSSSSQPIYNDNQDWIGSRESIRDITQRKKMEEELVKNQKMTQLLAQKLLHLQEYEKSRLSQEIHDGLSQTIPAVSYRLSSVIESVPREYEALKKDLVEIQTLVEEMSVGVRRTLMGLRPEVLDSLGLVAATMSFITNMSERFGFKTQIDIDNLKVVKPADQIHIFRIIQETLINVGKHAQAKNVSIKCKKLTGILVLTIKDDGRGYEENEIKKLNKNGHYGRLIMEERAKMMGAIINIETIRGKGTVVGLEYPYENKT